MLPDFAHEFPSVGGDLVVENRSEIWSVGLKPRLGNIATPGRVCPPHNETYDCRIYPNGIGCLRRGGGSGTGRPTGQESAFRTDSASERDGLPVRSVRFPIRASRTLRRLAYSGYAAGKRERKERERDEAPPGAASVRRRTGPPGDRIENAAGERDRSIRESGSALRSPRARKARATGLRAVRVGLSRQKCRTNPEHLPNPITHFVTPAVLGGVFGSYFPMAGNPLAWSRLENACTWHIRYINAYNRSAKYFSIPKPG